MNLYGVPPPVGVGPRFQSIILGLCCALGFPVDRARAPVPMMDQVFRLLRRRLRCFLALVARFHAGTLPVARPDGAAPVERSIPKRATDALVPSPSRRALLPMPRGPAWLVAMVGYRAAAYSELLERYLADPEVAKFLAAAPQAARLLRPLWRMLNRHAPPKVLRAQPRSRSTAPSADTPEKSAPLTASPHASPGAPRRRRRRLRPDRPGASPLVPA